MSDDYDPADDFHLIARITAEVSLAASRAALDAQAATKHDSPGDLRRAHGKLLETLRETRRAIDRVEHTLDRLDWGPSTPRRITREHAQRIGDEYDGPVRYLALELLEANRREWLHCKPDTLGAERVERHGLTENQRETLNRLREAWRAYEGGEGGV